MSDKKIKKDVEITYQPGFLDTVGDSLVLEVAEQSALPLTERTGFCHATHADPAGLDRLEKAAHSDGAYWRQCRDAKIADRPLALPKGSITFNEPENIVLALGTRQWRGGLARLMALVETLKFVTSRGEITCVFIPSDDERFVNAMRSSRAVRRAVAKAVEIGLLSPVCSDYHFEQSPDRDGYCKLYAYNKNMQDRLTALAKKHHVKPLKPRQSVLSHMLVTVHPDMAPDRFGSLLPRIRLFDRGSLPADLTLKDIACGLKLNYPCIGDTLTLINSLNNRISDPVNKISMRFKVKTGTSGRYTRISTRATSSFCSFSKKDRRAFLEEKFPGGYTEVDINASIPQTACLMSGRHVPLMDSGIDMYELLYGRPFATKELRDSFKLFTMYVNFGCGAKDIIAKLTYGHCCWASLNRFGENAVLQSIQQLINRIVKVQGRIATSEAFLHESCVLARVREKLMDMYGNDNVYQVYDGFYVGKRLSPAEKKKIHNMISDIREKYYKKYILPAAQLQKDFSENNDDSNVNDSLSETSVNEQLLDMLSGICDSPENSITQCVISSLSGSSGNMSDSVNECVHSASRRHCIENALTASLRSPGIFNDKQSFYSPSLFSQEEYDYESEKNTTSSTSARGERERERSSVGKYAIPLVDKLVSDPSEHPPSRYHKRCGFSEKTCQNTV